jgi:hypothetical protein
MPLLSLPFFLLVAAYIRRTAEDSLNIALREITVTARDGRVSQLEQVYIRGSTVRAFLTSPR